MKLDITLNVTPEMVAAAQANDSFAKVGHLGTHFDVMDQVFPLPFTELDGIVFDVSHVKDRDITLADIDVSRVQAGMFVAFCTGFLEEAGYGTVRYVSEHPQLADALLTELVNRQVSIIGIDFAGVRRGREHSYWDRTCADHGVFIVENLCGLKALAEAAADGHFTAHTYPMRFAEMTGLPCRVIADV